MSKIVVLGAGLVGKAIAIDLRRSGHQLTSSGPGRSLFWTDLCRNHGVAVVQADFTGDHLSEIVKEADLVVGATLRRFWIWRYGAGHRGG